MGDGQPFRTGDIGGDDTGGVLTGDAVTEYVWSFGRTDPKELGKAGRVYRRGRGSGVDAVRSAYIYGFAYGPGINILGLDATFGTRDRARKKVVKK